MPARPDKRLWQRLGETAEAETAALIARLPANLRDAVRDVGIVFEARPSPRLRREGVEPDILGIFLGNAYAEPDDPGAPPQILLFLQNIWEDARRDHAEFRRQVRKTLLHEVGHYLGLEEQDLEIRGME
jgi:predicted Zn-dependent protease with MMP-like domain